MDRSLNSGCGASACNDELIPQPDRLHRGNLRGSSAKFSHVVSESPTCAQLGPNAMSFSRALYDRRKDASHLRRRVPQSLLPAHALSLRDDRDRYAGPLRVLPSSTPGISSQDMSLLGDDAPKSSPFIFDVDDPDTFFDFLKSPPESAAPTQCAAIAHVNGHLTPYSDDSTKSGHVSTVSTDCASSWLLASSSPTPLSFCSPSASGTFSGSQSASTHGPPPLQSTQVNSQLVHPQINSFDIVQRPTSRNDFNFILNPRNSLVAPECSERTGSSGSASPSPSVTPTSASGTSSSDASSRSSFASESSCDASRSARPASISEPATSLSSIPTSGESCGISRLASSASESNPGPSNGKLNRDEPGVCAYCCGEKIEWSKKPCAWRCPNSECQEAHCRFELYPLPDKLDFLPGFIIHGYIGSGAFSFVVGARDAYSVEVALKISCLNLPNVLASDVKAEYAALKVIQQNPSRHFVKVLGEVTRKVKPVLRHKVMSMGRCCRDVSTFLEGFLEEAKAVPCETALEIVRQVASALCSLLALGLHHLDIKPSNFLLDDTGVRLCDFGMSAEVRNGVLPNRCRGDPHYLAPELSDEKLSVDLDGELIDVFALGVSFVQLVTGAMFGEEPADSMRDRMLACGVPIAVVDLAVNMLNPDVTQRWRLQDLLDSEVLKSPPRKPVLFRRAPSPSAKDCVAHCCQAVRVQVQKVAPQTGLTAYASIDSASMGSLRSSTNSRELLETKVSETSCTHSCADSPSAASLEIHPSASRESVSTATTKFISPVQCSSVLSAVKTPFIFRGSVPELKKTLVDPTASNTRGVSHRQRDASASPPKSVSDASHVATNSHRPTLRSSNPRNSLSSADVDRRADMDQLSVNHEVCGHQTKEVLNPSDVSVPAKSFSSETHKLFRRIRAFCKRIGANNQSPNGASVKNSRVNEGALAHNASTHTSNASWSGDQLPLTVFNKLRPVVEDLESKASLHKVASSQVNPTTLDSPGEGLSLLQPFPSSSTLELAPTVSCGSPAPKQFCESDAVPQQRLLIGSFLDNSSSLGCSTALPDDMSVHQLQASSATCGRGGIQGVETQTTLHSSSQHIDEIKSDNTPVATPCAIRVCHDVALGMAISKNSGHVFESFACMASPASTVLGTASRSLPEDGDRSPPVIQSPRASKPNPKYGSHSFSEQSHPQQSEHPQCQNPDRPPTCCSWHAQGRDEDAFNRSYIPEEDVKENDNMMAILCSRKFDLTSEEVVCPDYNPESRTCPRFRQGKCTFIHNENRRWNPKKRKHCRNWMKAKGSNCSKCDRIHNSNPFVQSGIFNKNPKRHHPG